MLFTAAIIGAHRRRSEAAPPPVDPPAPLGDIPAPTVAFPASTVTGGTTDLTLADSSATIQSALNAGGIVRFTEAGTYDLSTWTTVRPSAALRIENTSGGEVVLDTGSDHYKSWIGTNVDEIFVVPKHRLEIEGGAGNFTFKGWATVVLLGNNNSNFQDLYGSGFNNHVDASDTPAVFHDGVALRNVRFTRGRHPLLSDSGINFKNLWAYGCDVIEQWGGFYLNTDPVGNVYVYDCYFFDIGGPDGNAFYRKVGMCLYCAINKSTSVGWTNFYIESCTADVMTNRGTGKIVGDSENGLLRITGADGGPNRDQCVVRNCIVRRVGEDVDGTKSVVSENVQALYFKARNVTVENCEFDNCYGNEGILTFKGATSNSIANPDNYPMNHTFRNLWFHDCPGAIAGLGNMAAISGKWGGGDRICDNILIEDCVSFAHVIGSWRSDQAHGYETLEVTDLTVRNLGGLGGPIITGSNAATTVDITNALIDNVPGNPVSFLKHQSISGADITLTDVEFRNVTSTQLVWEQRPPNSTTINGTTATGAETTSWHGSIGCRPRTNRLRK